MYRIRRLLSLSLILAAVSFSSCPVMAGDEKTQTSSEGEEHQVRPPHHAGHHVGEGGRGGGGRLGFELAEILMIPSLSKDQQNRLRSLYVAFRQQQQKDMSNPLSKPDFKGGSADSGHKRNRQNQNKQGRNSPSSAMGEQILAGLVGEKKDGKTAQNEETKASADARSQNSGAGFQHERFKVMMKFNADILAVLSRNQRKELRDIGIKTGSPDYFMQRKSAL